MRVNWEPNQNMVDQAEQLAERKSASQEALQHAADQFEALFLYYLLSEMRKTVPDNDLLGDRRGKTLPIHAGSGDRRSLGQSPEYWFGQTHL